LLLLLGNAALAHEMRPAYLELRETGGNVFQVLWKVPMRGEMRLALTPRLPADCETTGPLDSSRTGEALIQRWQVACDAGLVGRRVAVAGLESTLTEVLVRIEHAGGGAQVQRLTPAAPALTVTGAPSRLRIIGTYTALGVEHILLGIDHLLFVLALLIIVPDRRRLLVTITAFTIAHSLTLGAATLDLVRLPIQPVEAVIALSILFLATEIVHGRRGRRGLTERRPWIVAFAFGLLHGLGFASVLNEIGLPEHAIPTALLFFNVGVELGQIGFIAVVLGLMTALRRLPVPRPAWAWRVPAYAIGGIAASWTIERTVGFWG